MDSHIGEAWEHKDGAVAVIIAAAPTTKADEVLLSACGGWTRYADLPALGWVRLPWRMTMTPDPEATP